MRSTFQPRPLQECERESWPWANVKDQAPSEANLPASACSAWLVSRVAFSFDDRVSGCIESDTVVPIHAIDPQKIFNRGRALRCVKIMFESLSLGQVERIAFRAGFPKRIDRAALARSDGDTLVMALHPTIETSKHAPGTSTHFVNP